MSVMGVFWKRRDDEPGFLENICSGLVFSKRVINRLTLHDDFVPPPLSEYNVNSFVWIFQRRSLLLLGFKRPEVLTALMVCVLVLTRVQVWCRCCRPIHQ